LISRRALTAITLQRVARSTKGVPQNVAVRLLNTLVLLLTHFLKKGWSSRFSQSGSQMGLTLEGVEG